MAQNIVLINVNTCTSPYPVYPLGLGHLAAALNAAGYRAHILDLALDNAELEGHISRRRPAAIGLSLRNIDDIQIDNTRFYAPILKEISRRIRAVSSSPIVLGGSGYSLFPQSLLDFCGADFGIAGEAEMAFVSLLDCLRSKGDYHSIPGLAFRHNGRIVVNRKSPCPPGLIRTPVFPRRFAHHYIEKSSMLNIQTQRGCAYRCSYCTYPVIEGRKFRRRSPGQVCGDIAAAQRAGARYVFFVDSVFNTSAEHVSNICEEMLRRNMRMKWGCFLRPKGATMPLMELMARAGLTHIEFGTDSLCDTMLESYRKDFTVDDVVHASDCARACGIYFAHFLIFGGPGETEHTIRISFKNSKRISRTVFFPFIGVRIYPGTPLYARARREGNIETFADYLTPHFYISPHVSQKKIARMLAHFHALRHNWALGDVSQQNSDAIRGLRKLGIAGPLWEYIIR